MPKCAIRFRPVRSVAAFRGATKHARREDATSRKRVREGATPGAALSWMAHGVKGRDHLAAFRAHKTATGAQERAGAPLALQAICVVSPEWIDAGGDRHDPRNPRNRALMQQSRDWAESWAGPGSVIAARLDLDEAGGGVVDLTIVPTRTQRNRSGKETLRISTNAALSELAASVGERRSYAAAQTSWAAWCQRTLDPAIERGTPKSETKAEHMRPEAYGAMMDALKASEATAIRITEAAQTKAAQLAEKGRRWAATFRRETVQQARVEATAERERILAPVASLRGMWGTLSKRSERERSEAVEKARDEERRKVKAAEEEARDARRDALEERRRSSNLRASLTDVTAQRDTAWQRLGQVDRTVPGRNLDPRRP